MGINPELDARLWARADAVCELCGDGDADEYIAHHLDYTREFDEWLSDVVLLCRRCHVLQHFHSASSHRRFASGNLNGFRTLRPCSPHPQSWPGTILPPRLLLAVLQDPHSDLGEKLGTATLPNNSLLVIHENGIFTPKPANLTIEELAYDFLLPVALEISRLALKRYPVGEDGFPMKQLPMPKRIGSLPLLRYQEALGVSQDA